MVVDGGIDQACGGEKIQVQGYGKYGFNELGWRRQIDEANLMFGERG
jgi:hypothetical protein